MKMKLEYQKQRALEDCFIAYKYFNNKELKRRVKIYTDLSDKIFYNQRKKEDRVVLTDSSGDTKSEREERFNTLRLEMDNHADSLRGLELCSWKEIMMKELNQYECKECDGRNDKCSAYYVLR